jgi:hypothetical protein
MITINNLESNKYTEEELEKYINSFNVVHWYWISIYQDLSERFIEKFKEKLDWYYISWHQTLSELFIEKYKNKVDWYHISRYQKLSENFLLNNLEYVVIDWLEDNKNLPKELLEKVKFMKELQ